MGQQTSRPAFDCLLTKTHVLHALVQQDGRHNDIPTALATLLFLEGTPEMFQEIYEAKKDLFSTWNPSPGAIADEDTKTRLLGDIRFQRSFMTYFSMENGRFGGNSKVLAIAQLFTRTKPLVFGLFSGLGLPLVFLSDGIELRSSVMVVESLTVAAVDWTDPIFEILTHPQLARPASDLLSPEQIIRRLSYDGRFSGIMKSGPGYHGVINIFSNPNAKAAVVEYIQQLDCRNLATLLPQLAALSVQLLCATHKPNSPAFDFYLSQLLITVNSARVLLEDLEEGTHRVIVARGVWLLFILAYVTQLRPVMDTSLLFSTEHPAEDGGWTVIYNIFCEEGISDGRFADTQYLRVLRSLRELDKAYGSVHGNLYTQAAWKLLSQWESWTGLGADREATLNIRL
ncbi:oxidoreductase AflY [Podospora australis]|uniref:Oxidoreductase AflY n=1 Tax=Podospora australis TaxID=1536484 RepID=A0AAN6X2X2_9PEZI|nr:oxidoreductase AflY [Podospora australis]